MFPNSSYFWLQWTQFFPPRAQFTEENLPSLAGKNFIVTGGSSGIGRELVRVLYGAGGTVFLLTRDRAKSEAVIEDTISRVNTKNSVSGSISFIYADFNDLSTIPPAVDQLLSSCSRLDVLFNNAGISKLPPSQRTKQGLEPHWGINVVAPYLLTKLLHPLLSKTAKLPDTKPGSVRVIWTASIMVESHVPPGGVDISFTESGDWQDNKALNYASSKAANWFLATEFQTRCGKSGRTAAAEVLHIAQNPGSLRTPVFRNWYFYEYAPWWWMLGHAVDGANTNLWCAFSADVGVEDGGRYAMPSGRWHPGQRVDLERQTRSVQDGGTGDAERIFEWCEQQSKPFQKV